MSGFSHSSGKQPQRDVFQSPLFSRRSLCSNGPWSLALERVRQSSREGHALLLCVCSALHASCAQPVGARNGGNTAAGFLIHISLGYGASHTGRLSAGQGEVDVKQKRVAYNHSMNPGEMTSFPDHELSEAASSGTSSTAQGLQTSHNHTTLTLEGQQLLSCVSTERSPHSSAPQQTSAHPFRVTSCILSHARTDVTSEPTGHSWDGHSRALPCITEHTQSTPPPSAHSSEQFSYAAPLQLLSSTALLWLMASSPFLGASPLSRTVRRSLPIFILPEYCVICSLRGVSLVIKFQCLYE